MGATQMVNQFMPVLQEGLPGVEVGADRLDPPQTLLGRVVKDGQGQLLQQCWGQAPVLGRGPLWWGHRAGGDGWCRGAEGWPRRASAWRASSSCSARAGLTDRSTS